MLLLPGQQNSLGVFVTLPTFDGQTDKKSLVPQVDDVILAKIVKLSYKTAVLEWSHLGAASTSFRGTLRTQDVFIEKDENPTLPLFEIFTVGQELAVKILGYGDFTSGFFLSFTKKE